jgi:2-dehydro-3-deoxygalactonokinase
VERTLGDGARLRFLPGVCQRAPLPDVMRGEEIQVFGAVGEDESGVLVHPGTHCKWVRVEDGAIAGFRTFMTGEIYGVLTKHSILGRLIPAGERGFDRDAFADGVRQALSDASAGLLNDLFTARSGALLEAFPAGAIADRLSGLLIGHEVQSGLALGWSDAPPILFGEPALTERYALAFAIAGRGSRPGPEQATVKGFERLSRLPAAPPQR